MQDLGDSLELTGSFSDAICYCKLKFVCIPTCRSCFFCCCFFSCLKDSQVNYNQHTVLRFANIVFVFNEAN